MLNTRASLLFAFALAGAACGGNADPLDVPITFTLENALSTSVFTEVAGCGTEAWLSIKNAKGETLTLHQSGPCSNECGGALVFCARAAEAACIAPMARELPPGQKAQLSWDGLFSRWNQEDTCNEPFAASGELEATMCWGTASEPNNGQVLDPTCKTAKFMVQSGATVKLSTEN